MKLNEYLANRLKEVFTEGKWVLGTNFKEQIIDLDWEQATQKIDDFNTIADLTFHIHYYIAGVANVLKGGTLDIRDKYSFDYPPIESERDWRDLVNKFCLDSEEFIELVKKMSEEKILSDFVDKQYGTYCRNIDAMIEHSYYHLGQIILIKKRIK
jgi:beta-xylosidase